MVSAVPENLTTYAAACTWHAQQVQNWVSSVLTPALRAYESSGKGHAAATIDSEVARAISRAYYTDRDVETVAQAFRQSQHGPLGAHGRVTADDSAVNSAFDRIQQQSGARMRAGAALAQKLMALHPPGEDNRLGDSPAAAKPIIQELAKHADDPYFCAGFYNSLDGPQLDTALALGGIPALVSAYSSGAVSAHTTSLVTMRVGAPAGHGGAAEGPYMPWSHINSKQKIQLLDGLTANPSAAYYLSKAVTRSEVREMFYGDRSVSGRVMTLLAAGMRGENSPQAARDLSHKVSLGLFGDGAPTLSNSEWQPLMDPLGDFYGLGALHGVSAPEEFSGEGLKEWQRVTGEQVGQDAALFLKGLHAADPDNTLIKSMVQGGYVNVMFIPAGSLGPEGVVFTAALGALQSAYSSADPGAKLLDRAFPPGEHPDVHEENDKLANGGFVQTLSMLSAMGQAHHGSEPVVLSGDKDHDKEIIDRMLRHPESYTFGKDKVSVNDLLDAYARTEQDDPLNATGNDGYKPPYG